MLITMIFPLSLTVEMYGHRLSTNCELLLFAVQALIEFKAALFDGV